MGWLRAESRCHVVCDRSDLRIRIGSSKARHVGTAVRLAGTVENHLHHVRRRNIVDCSIAGELRCVDEGSGATPGVTALAAPLEHPLPSDVLIGGLSNVTRHIPGVALSSMTNFRFGSTTGVSLGVGSENRRSLSSEFTDCGKDVKHADKQRARPYRILAGNLFGS
jgi:hypothetical protein